MKSTLDNVVKLDESLTKAEQKVDEVKETLGLGSRRLIFDALSDIKNIYNNLVKARE